MIGKLAVVVLFVIGFGIGVVLYLINISIYMLSKAVELFLYILIASIGIVVAYEAKSIKEVMAGIDLSVRLVIATILGSILGGILTALILHSDVIVYLAIALGMGWYTFTGSYLATIDSYLGLLGFTANMFREIATILLYPILSKKYPIEAISIGGATTMDTTLPIIARFTNTSVTIIAFIHGLILTLLIPIIIPAIMATNPKTFIPSNR
ncbi:MAG: lysine exporter LysO family protein [Ignisphaera sp.]|uniref:Lysine exporter LysO family protein n=1 Tax=Ignisphaera aggregans TaxID=334771 RepID=A0A7J3JRR4_9CREN